ncbi:MAG TPA: FAD-dependent oxidoreductase [Sedimentisphaerales bacterium]|nr:FAD-dependent oxidoreductase [Sedimentisphaerales bacterium]
MKTTRRNILGLGGLGLGATVAGPWVAAAAGTVTEPGRQVSIAGNADVIVCGAGPAGVSAAVAAARRGVRVLLLEGQGCLGGIWTAGMLSWMLDYRNKAGLMRELLERLAKAEGLARDQRGVPTNGYDVEVMKITLEALCTEAKVRIQLHTRVCAAIKDNEGRLTHVLTESPSGREAFAGRVFVDCTGLGDLGALAGCGFDFGHPETGRGQPMSLMALVAGIRADEVGAFYRDDDTADWAKPKDTLRSEMERGGHSPSYAKPTLFRIRDDLFALMANHEYDARGTNAREMTRATLHARAELHHLITGLRSLGGVWKNVRLVATAAQIGVREGRRIRGLYAVSSDDLREGREHPDAVCKVTFPVDVHATDATKGKGIERSPFLAKPYDIPMRALIAKDVTGLMMAGRCISGDFVAHASYRVTGNAVAMGEAAGKVAAVAAATRRLPQAVGSDEWRESSR